jgi:hypothetical protein
VNVQGGENEGFDGISDLQNRFKSLKYENKKLVQRKKAINEDMEKARAKEKTKLNELKDTLYDRQREM